MENRSMKPARQGDSRAQSHQSEAQARRLAGAKLGGSTSARRRAERVERLEVFRAALLRQESPLEPAVRAALADAACSLYGALLRHSSLSLSVNPKANLLGISAAATSLRAVLRELRLLGTEPEDATQTAQERLAAHLASRVKPELGDK